MKLLAALVSALVALVAASDALAIHHGNPMIGVAMSNGTGGTIGFGKMALFGSAHTNPS